MSIYTENEALLSKILQHHRAGETGIFLLKIRKDFTELAEWIQKNNECTKKNLVLSNLLKASASYLDLAISNQDGLVQILAFSVRCLFEIHLWVRYTQNSASNLEKWVIEAHKDKMDILKCLAAHIENICNQVGVSTNLFEQTLKLLEEEREHICMALKENHIEEPKRNIRISEIAEKTGQKTEYEVFFKIFSKFSHPTSFLINNSSEEIQRLEIRSMFLIHIQLYAGDIYENVKKIVRMEKTLEQAD